jgi:hypothetical protein
MKPLLRLAALLVAAGMAAASADAQVKVQVQPVQVQPVPVQVQPLPGQPLPGPFLNPQVVLLMNKDVQKDLRLTEEQVQKVNDITKKQMDVIKDIPPGKDGFKKIQEVLESSKKELDGILSKEQAARLQQLILQAKGPAAFFDPVVLRELKIEPDQQGKLVKTVAEAMGKQFKVIIESKDLKPDEIQKKFAAMNREVVGDIVKQLTAEQQTKWKEMTGRAFDGVLPTVGPGFGPLPPPPPIKIKPIELKIN